MAVFEPSKRGISPQSSNIRTNPITNVKPGKSWKKVSSNVLLLTIPSKRNEMIIPINYKLNPTNKAKSVCRWCCGIS
ncbi:MAG: hypothetical protein ACW99Q_21960, partial [Candidatus Kariarchaeaceae archaeon]